MTNLKTTATGTTGRPVRRRGIVRLDEEILGRILDLPAGQRIIGFRDHPMRLCIDVGIEGDGLPECPPGADPWIVNAEPYTTRFSRWAMRGRDLEEMVRLVATEIDRSADPDATRAGSELLRILDGTYDPRAGKPGKAAQFDAAGLGTSSDPHGQGGPS